jgi:DMSO reductase anchor subunit
MLVLSQMAVGLHIAHVIIREVATAYAAFAVLHAALLVSVAHLGRPLKAWRAFLGWRRSWMSREIIVFGAYAATSAALVLFPQNRPLAHAVAMIGLAGVFCSAMIYIDTQRPAWRREITFPRFFGTTFLLGAAAGGTILAWLGSHTAQTFAVIATIIRTWLFITEMMRNAEAVRSPQLPEHHAAVAAASLLAGVTKWRTGLFTVATISSITAIFSTTPLWPTLSLIATLAGCVLERYTFFTACAAPRMPGL